MQIKKLGKTILAIKNINTNKVTLVEYSTIEEAEKFIRRYQSLFNQDNYKFFLSEKTERGPVRKKWNSWLKPK